MTLNLLLLSRAICADFRVNYWGRLNYSGRISQPSQKANSRLYRGTVGWLLDLDRLLYSSQYPITHGGALWPLVNKTHPFPTTACIVRTVVSDIFSVHAMPCKPPMQRERLSPPFLPPLHLYFLLYFLYAARAHKWLCAVGRGMEGRNREFVFKLVLFINALSVDDRAVHASVFEKLRRRSSNLLISWRSKVGLLKSSTISLREAR